MALYIKQFYFNIRICSPYLCQKTFEAQGTSDTAGCILPRLSCSLMAKVVQRPQRENTCGTHTTHLWHMHKIILLYKSIYVPSHLLSGCMPCPFLATEATSQTWLL